MAKVKILSDEEGRCPYCNCEDFYHIEDEFFSDISGTCIFRKLECKSCLRHFGKWFKLTFVSNGVGDFKDIDAKGVLGQEIDYKEEE